MSEKSYLPSGVFLVCDKGVLPTPLTVTSALTVDVLGSPVATDRDQVLGVNIKPFGVCATTHSACAFVALPPGWSPVKDDVVMVGGHPLLEDSQLRCATGAGCISVFMSLSAAMLGVAGHVNDAVNGAVDGVIKQVEDGVTHQFDKADDYLKTLGWPLGDYAREELGKVEGVWEGASGIVTGLWGLSKMARNLELKTANVVAHAIEHPAETGAAIEQAAQRGWTAVQQKDTWLAAGNGLLNAVPGVQAAKAAVWLSDPVHRAQAWKVTKAAYAGASKYLVNPRNRGKLQGRAAFEVLFAFFTAGTGEVANVGKATEVINGLEKGGEALNALEKGGEALKAADGALATGKVVTGAVEETAERTLAEEGTEQGAKQLETVEGGANKDASICEKDPVNVATGDMILDSVDIELPGPISLVWARTWYSTSHRQGPLGYGWHHSYDLALWIDATRQVHLRLADGRRATFAPLTAENDFCAYHRGEQLELRAQPRGPGYVVSVLREQLTYYFAPAALTGGPAPAGGPQRLTHLADAHGHAITFSYGPQGQLASLLDSAGRHIGVRTDAAGRVLALDLPAADGSAGTFAAVQYAYDEAGNLTSATDAEGYAANYAYGPAHLLKTHTFRTGIRFYFEYDAQRRCVHTWGDENYLNGRFLYTEGHTILLSEEPSSRQEYYHRQGLVSQHVDAGGSVWTWHYNAYGELELARDPLGHSTGYDYDSRGHLVGTTLPDGSQVRTQYNAHGQPTQATDANGGVWQLQYDAQGQLTERTDPLGACTRYSYDEQGRVAEVVDALGHATRLRYDTQHNLAHLVAPDNSIRSRTYDALGRLVKLTDELGQRQQRHYDRLGQLVATQEADGLFTRLTYDGEGNVIRVHDGVQEVEFMYTAVNRLAVRRQAGQQVAFTYDREGRLVGLTNEHGHRYRFTLDAAGRVAEEEGFDGLLRRYERDAAGRVTLVQRPAGRTTAYAYNAVGRLISVTHNQEAPTTYTYDATGALLEARTATMTVRLKRDARGRLVGEQQGTHTIACTYDARGQRTGLRSSLGAAFMWQHDQIGNLSAMQAGEDWQAQLLHDARGLEVQRQFSGGLRLDWQRDAVGRPTSQRVAIGLHPTRQRRYQWQGTDQLVAIEDSLTGTTRYSYDALGGLTEARYADGSQDLRLLDAVGNLFRSPTLDDRQYAPGGQLRQIGGTQYKHDEEGNLICKTNRIGQVWHYDWNGAGQLTSVILPSGYAVTFTYDALGRRVSKHYRGRVTRWVWDGDQPLHEWSELEVGPGAGSVQDLTTWFFEEDSFAPAAKLTEKGAYSVVCDHLGTPLMLYNDQGAATWEMSLDSYGGVRQGQGKAQDCPFRYQGQYEDVETGLYYNRFRYYDPEVGQYISNDPIKLYGGIRSYSYVQNPNAWIDAFGLVQCRAVNGQFQKAQTAQDEAKSLPEFRARTKGDIRAGLKKRGYTKIKSVNGDETWVRHTADGKVAVARLDAPVTRVPSAGYADEVPHAHKEIANGYHVDPSNGQGYTNGGIKKFDDLGNQTNNAGLQHIPTKN